MKYFNIIPRRSNSLTNIKKDIRNCSIVSCCHFFLVACVVIVSNPWPSDFRDPGLKILLYCLLYLFIINLLNGIFLYDEHQESTDINKEFGPVFNTCKLIRHTIFWIFGCYTHCLVISLAVQKLRIALYLQLIDLYTRRICFLVWSAFSLLVDVYWIIKTCVYHQIINSMETNNINQHT